VIWFDDEGVEVGLDFDGAVERGSFGCELELILLVSGEDKDED